MTDLSDKQAGKKLSQGGGGGGEYLYPLTPPAYAPVVDLLLSSHCLQPPFYRVEYSLIKTFVMMIGEFNMDDIFHTHNYLQPGDPYNQDDFLGYLFYDNTTYIFVTVFVTMMSIIVMNLLVSDAAITSSTLC